MNAIRVGGLLLLVVMGSRANYAIGQAPAHVLNSAELPKSIRDQLSRGQVTRVSPAGVDTLGAATQVSLRKGEVLAARTGEVVTSVPREPGRGPASEGAGSDSVFRLPFTYVGLDRAGTSSMVYRPVFVPEGPLKYQPDDDRFVGTFLLGLQDTVHPTTAEELSSPVRMRFGGEADAVEPEAVILSTTNSQMERIRVSSIKALDSVRILVVPTFDPRGVAVWLHLQPTLAFDKTPKSLQGFGVEGVTLVIGTRGVGSSDSVPVTLSVDRGALESNRVLVSGGGAVVKLRSAGIGPATVSARAPGWRSAQTTIEYGWPVATVVSAVIGGLLGALVASLNAKKRASANIAGSLTKGILVGVVVCAVYLGLGINLLGFKVNIQYFNETAVFALSALASLFGIPALAAKAADKSK
jgi:hypothetical protein